MSSKNGQAGFSLIELMVVVAIIGILASIAIPNYQRFTAKTKQGEAKSNLSALYSTEKSFQSEWQTYVADFNVLGYRPTGWVRYEHGFTGAFPAAMPAGYAGALPAGFFNTAAFCGAGAINANGCGIVNTPIAPQTVAAAGGGLPTITTFIATATAHIGNANAARFDTWHINEQRAITQTAAEDGLP